MKIKFIAKLTAFTASALAAVILLGMIVTPKWTAENAAWEPATRMVQGFYNEPNNSLDVLYLGSSLVYRDISPIDMWEDYGFTGYDCGSSVQRMWISYYYLEEALKTQTPKVVVLNMNGITDDTYNDEDRNRKALDYIKFSPTKLQAVKSSIPDSESFLSYLFPLLRYHSRWDSLTDEDIMDLFSDRHYYAKGQDLQFSTVAYQPKSDWLQPTAAVAKEGKKAGRYFDRIVSLCKSKGIPLLLIDMISPVRFHYEVHNLNQSIAKQNGLPYLDFNFMTDQIGLNWNTDFMDKGVHLNVKGAEKLSKFLGAYLKRHYSLNKAKSANVQTIWNQDAQAYRQKVADFALAGETDFTAYLKKLNNPQYCTLIAVNGYVAAKFTPEQIGAFRAIGLKTDFSGRKNWSYLAVVDGSSVLEKSSKQPISFRKTVEGLDLKMDSSGFDTGGSANIRLNRSEYATGQPGFNIVVFDKQFGTIIDRVSFNVDSCQLAYRPGTGLGR